MKKTTTLIIIAVVAVLAIWAVTGYNGLVSMDEKVSNQWANVETQYQRRADLIPNLVNTVKGYQGLCRPRTGDTGRSHRSTQQGHANQSRPRRPDTGEAGRIPSRTRTTGLGSGQTAGYYRELSRPKGQPELPGTAGPTGRHGEPHQRGTQELQRHGPRVQYRHPPLPQEHPGRTVRLRKACLFRGSGRSGDGTDGGVLRTADWIFRQIAVSLHHASPRQEREAASKTSLGLISFRKKNRKHPRYTRGFRFFFYDATGAVSG